MTESATAPDPAANLVYRRLEFAALYLAAPIAMAGLVAGGVVSARSMPNVFAGVFVFALILLARTRGFYWRSLFKGGLVPNWGAALLFFGVTAAGVYLLTLWLAPWSLFGLPNRSPELWTRILIFYPLLSVIPQGIIYRVLFFARYADLFPNRMSAIAANALAFGLGHLFYLNPVAVGLTVVGGAAFGWAYTQYGSFWFANLLHAFGGWTIFTVGLGVYFYHGAI